MEDRSYMFTAPQEVVDCIHDELRAQGLRAGRFAQAYQHRLACWAVCAMFGVRWPPLRPAPDERYSPAFFWVSGGMGFVRPVATRSRVARWLLTKDNDPTWGDIPYIHCVVHAREVHLEGWAWGMEVMEQDNWGNPTHKADPCYMFPTYRLRKMRDLEFAPRHTPSPRWVP